MNRYYVTLPNGTFKYYAKSEEAVKKSFPDATAIVPCKDVEYLDYITEIKARSRICDTGLWIVDTAFGKYYYRQFLDNDNNQIDGCKWRKVDAIRCVEPILWTLDTPKDFFETFLRPDYYTFADSHWTRIDYLEWAKIKKQGGFKALKVPNQFGEKFWCNPQGVVYEVDKQSSIHKKAWKDYKENSAAFAGTKPPFNPDLSKNCFRLPYIPILNQNILIHNMALIWQKRMKEEMENNIDYRVFCREVSNYPTELLEKIIEEARNAFHN